MNVIHLRGHLSRDIEIRYLQSGMATAKTSIATNRKYVNKGETKEEVMFMDLIFFSRSAEIANQYLRKGSDIIVTGRVSQTKWVDKFGQNRVKHEVIVENMEMIRTPSQGSNENQTPEPQQQYQPQAQPQQQTLEVEEMEIPF